jgi:hypothetical protein
VLVEHGDSRTRLVEDWWDYQRRSHGDRAERETLKSGEAPAAQAAYDRVEASVQTGGPDAVALLVALNDAAPADDGGQTVGAGPLEELVHEHGDALARELVETARRSPSFAAALKHVWLETGHLQDATEEKLAPWVQSQTH